MNFYFIFIISALIVEFILARITGYLNITSLSPELPEEFKNSYDESKYQNSQHYARTNEKFDIVSGTFDFLFIMCVILFGLFNVLDVFVRSIGFQSETINGLLFFGIFMIFQDIISTPFSLYRHFVIEERFGFNKMTIKTFVIDKIKGLFLMILIGIPLLGIIQYFFESFGDIAWFYAWAIVSAFILVLQPLFTTFIAPLFNTFTPLEEGELKDSINSYSKKVQFPISRIDIMDGSKRSSHSNAYFSGIGKRKRIALYDTLVEKQSAQEILAIVAHEVGHYKKRHIQKGIVLSIISSGFMFFMLSVFMKNPQLFAVFSMEKLSVYGSLVFFQILFSPINMLLSLFKATTLKPLRVFICCSSFK